MKQNSTSVTFESCRGLVVNTSVCVRDVLGSNLNPQTGYRDRFILVFLSPAMQILG
jgi:hypothetical protein